MDLENSDWYLNKLINYLKTFKKDGANLQDTPANVTNLFKDKK